MKITSLSMGLVYHKSLEVNVDTNIDIPPLLSPKILTLFSEHFSNRHVIGDDLYIHTQRLIIFLVFIFSSFLITPILLQKS